MARVKAFKKFRTQFTKLSSSDRVHEEAAAIMREYLSSKFTLDGQSLTKADVRRQLAPFGLSSTLQDDIRAFIELCDRGQYGGIADDASHGDQVRADLMKIVKTIEKEVT